jgi:hypothetical protein
VLDEVEDEDDEAAEDPPPDDEPPVSEVEVLEPVSDDEELSLVPFDDDGDEPAVAAEPAVRLSVW